MREGGSEFSAVGSAKINFPHYCFTSKKGGGGGREGGSEGGARTENAYMNYDPGIESVY